MQNKNNETTKNLCKNGYGWFANNIAKYIQIYDAQLYRPEVNIDKKIHWQQQQKSEGLFST